MNLITLGKVQGIFGLNGWLKIYSWTDPKENIFNYENWYLDFDENSSNLHADFSSLKYKIKQGKPHKKGLIACIENIQDANAAQSLVGAFIKVNKADLPALPDGEYYWQDLIGLEVIDLDGNLFGQVKDLLQTGANDCLIVKPSRGSIDNNERVLPYLQPEVIKQIDLAKKIISVDWDKDF